MSNKLANVINKNPTAWGIILCLVLAAFGGLVMKFGFDQRKENAYLRGICTEEITGVVTGYHKTGKIWVDDDDETQDTRQDYPVYEYEVGEKTYSVQSERYDSKGKYRYKIGEKLPVRYAPGDPEKHYLPGEAKAADRNAWLCVGFGVFLLAFSGFGIFRMITMGGKKI